jgi:hypothetical protein
MTDERTMDYWLAGMYFFRLHMSPSLKPECIGNVFMVFLLKDCSDWVYFMELVYKFPSLSYATLALEESAKGCEKTMHPPDCSPGLNNINYENIVDYSSQFIRLGSC